MLPLHHRAINQRAYGAGPLGLVKARIAAFFDAKTPDGFPSGVEFSGGSGVVVDERLPGGEHEQVAPELLHGRFADLPDALLGDAELGGDFVEGGFFEEIAPEDHGLSVGQAREGGLHGFTKVAGFGGVRRAGRVEVDELEQGRAFGVGLVHRGGHGGARDAVELLELGVAQSGGGRDFGGGRRAAEAAFELGGGAAHGVELSAGPPRERVEPPEFVEDGATDAGVTVGTGFDGGPVKAAHGFDDGDLAGAGEIFARDVGWETSIELVEDRIDDGEDVADGGLGLLDG